MDAVDAASHHPPLHRHSDTFLTAVSLEPFGAARGITPACKPVKEDRRKANHRASLRPDYCSLSNYYSVLQLLFRSLFLHKSQLLGTENSILCTNESAEMNTVPGIIHISK